MKEICLVRHAKSSWKYPKLDDFERPLNKRGRRNAPFMAKIVSQLGFSPDLIITSPASRAAMTARILAVEINYPLEKIRYLASIYESDEIDLIHILEGLDDNIKKVILVGHNPALTSLANKISDYSISNIPTSGVFCVALNITSWSGIKNHPGKLKYFEFPKKHE
jgi:phosphohistidine phosphatase